MIIDFNFNDEKLNVLWNEYQNKRNLGLKKDANNLLNQFINQLKGKDIIEEFARNINMKNYWLNVLQMLCIYVKDCFVNGRNIDYKMKLNTLTFGVI